MYANKPKRRRPASLNTASAYYRVAGKFERAGNYRMADHYRKVADSFVQRHRNNSNSNNKRT